MSSTFAVHLGIIIDSLSLYSLEWDLFAAPSPDKS